LKIHQNGKEKKGKLKKFFTVCILALLWKGMGFLCVQWIHWVLPSNIWSSGFRFQLSCVPPDASFTYWANLHPFGQDLSLSPCPSLGLICWTGWYLVMFLTTRLVWVASLRLNSHRLLLGTAVSFSSLLDFSDRVECVISHGFAHIWLACTHVVFLCIESAGWAAPCSLGRVRNFTQFIRPKVSPGGLHSDACDEM
jgi:hypothetical protein